MLLTVDTLTTIRKLQIAYDLNQHGLLFPFYRCTNRHGLERQGLQLLRSKLSKDIAPRGKAWKRVMQLEYTAQFYQLGLRKRSPTRRMLSSYPEIHNLPWPTPAGVAHV